MTNKKQSLSAALHEATGRKLPASAEPIMSTISIPKATPVRSARSGTKVLSGHFDPAVSRQFKQLALDQDSTVQSLLAEAINDLFIKYNRNPIA